MKTLSIYTLLILVLFSFNSSAVEIGNELVKKYSEFIAGTETIKDANVATLDGFRFESVLAKQIQVNQVTSKPELSDEQLRILTVSKIGLPTVSLIQKLDIDESYGVSIFKKDSGEPNLTVSDQNGDGILDFLSYSIFDFENKLTKEITDYGMDGQVDMVINFKNLSAKIYYKGRWLKSDKANKFIFTLDNENISLSEARDYFEKNL